MKKERLAAVALILLLYLSFIGLLYSIVVNIQSIRIKCLEEDLDEIGARFDAYFETYHCEYCGKKGAVEPCNGYLFCSECARQYYMAIMAGTLSPDDYIPTWYERKIEELEEEIEEEIDGLYRCIDELEAND